MSELKPCPFCGGEAHLQYDPIGLATNARVHCVEMNCRADVWSQEGKDAAILMWNRRTQSEATAPAQDLSAAIFRDIAELEYDGLEQEEDVIKILPDDLHLILDRHLASSPANALSAGDRVDAELRNLTSTETHGDQSVLLTFASCRSAQAFKRAILAAANGGQK